MIVAVCDMSRLWLQLQLYFIICIKIVYEKKKHTQRLDVQMHLELLSLLLSNLKTFSQIGQWSVPRSTKSKSAGQGP